MKGAAAVGLLLVAWSAQEVAPHYTSAMLAQASFDLRFRSELRTQAGPASRVEQVGRDGRLELRVDDDGGGLSVEAWFDSLHIWRDGPEGRISPDPDPIIGGRFRGALTPDGRMTTRVRPFIPDDLVEVTDLGASLEGFLPRLPAVALSPGGVWQDGDLRIVRRSDSTGGGARLQRYRWSRVAVDTVEQFTDDSLRYVVRTRLEEEGDLVWHAEAGPMVWHRQAQVSVEIPADGPVRQPARTRVMEESWVWRRSAGR